jgi:hypothetical protein
MNASAPRDVRFTVTGSTKRNCVLEEIIPSRQMGVMWKGAVRIWMSKTGYFYGIAEVCVSTAFRS